MRLRVVVKCCREKTTTRNTSLEVVVCGAYRTTTSEPRWVRALMTRFLCDNRIFGCGSVEKWSFARDISIGVGVQARLRSMYWTDGIFVF